MLSAGHPLEQHFFRSLFAFPRSFPPLLPPSLPLYLRFFLLMLYALYTHARARVRVVCTLKLLSSEL